MKYRFEELFVPCEGGYYTPSRPVRVIGAVLSPGTYLSSTVSFGGLNLFDQSDSTVEVDEVEGIVQIKRFLPKIYRQRKQQKLTANSK